MEMILESKAHQLLPWHGPMCGQDELQFNRVLWHQMRIWESCQVDLSRCLLYLVHMPCVLLPVGLGKLPLTVFHLNVLCTDMLRQFHFTNTTKKNLSFLTFQFLINLINSKSSFIQIIKFKSLISIQWL